MNVVLARYSTELVGAGLLAKASCVCWGAGLTLALSWWRLLWAALSRLLLPGRI